MSIGQMKIAPLEEQCSAAELREHMAQCKAALDKKRLQRR